MGGESSIVKSKLIGGVDHVVGTRSAFAAAKQEGSVVSWGDAACGGNSDSVKGQLTGGVDRVVGNSRAFVAVKHDGSVVTWRQAWSGGNSEEVWDQLTAQERSGSTSTKATDIELKSDQGC